MVVRYKNVLAQNVFSTVPYLCQFNIIKNCTYAELKMKQKLNKTASRMTFVGRTIHKFLYW